MFIRFMFYLLLYFSLWRKMVELDPPLNVYSLNSFIEPDQLIGYPSIIYSTFHLYSTGAPKNMRLEIRVGDF